MRNNNKQSAALGFIFVTILVDCIGIGVIVPVVPKLIQTLGHVDNSHSSEISGWLQFAYAIMQFVFAPVLGGLSDRFGRRPVLLFSLLGFGIDYVFLAFAPTLFWLFVGRIIAGIFGASFTTASAYIADISAPEKRAQNFGLIGAAFGLGFILGPTIGGMVSGFGMRAPFIAAATLSLLNFLYGYFILPESLAKEHRRTFDWKRANPFSALKRVHTYPTLSGMVVSYVLIYLAGSVMQSVWQFFTIEKFQWDTKMIGYSLSFVGLSVGLVQGLLIRSLIPRLGQKRSVYIGLSLYTLGLLLFSFASEGWMMYVFMIPYALGGIAGPAIQGIVSNQVPANEQGELQGALTGLVSLTSIVGPLLMTSLFAYFTNRQHALYFPGAPFLMGAILSLLSVLFAMRSLGKLEHLKHK